MIHNFEKSLSFANDSRIEAVWIAFYKRVFKTVYRDISDRIENSLLQYKGIDRIITFINGGAYNFEEKVRRKDFDDFLCEIYSQWYGRNDHRNKIGWTLDNNKTSDFLVYAIAPLRKAYILPFPTLRVVAKTNCRLWCRNREGWLKTAKNGRYETQCCAVPWKILFRDMHKTYKAYPWGN